MTLEEFYKLAMTKVPEWEQEYRQQRETAPNGEHAFPLEKTRHGWLQDFEVWLHIKEAELTIKQANQKKEQIKQTAAENMVEFNLDSFE